VALYATLQIGDGAFRIFSDETMQRVLAYFLKKYMYSPSQEGSLAAEWAKRAKRPAEFALQPSPSLAKGAKSTSSRPDLTVGQLNRMTKTELRNRNIPKQQAKYTRAFRDALPSLWKTMGAVPLPNGGMGILSRSSMLGLKLGESMPSKSPSRSPMNSFFLGVEFGTGIYAAKKLRGINAGSPFKVGNKGMWAYSGDGSEFSPLFLGQRPFYMFYDKSGKPRSLYGQMVRRKMPDALKKILKDVRREVRHGG
jgi:hypothetical protein